MKKKTVILLVIALFIAGLALGFLAYHAINEIKSELRHERLEKAQVEKEEYPKEPAVVDTITPPQTNENKNQPPIDNSEFIGEEKAKEIVLQKAQLSEAEVDFIKVELDKDDGSWQYDVEFQKGRTEYDAEINALDGSILKWDVDYDD